jgi:hypothetical protein
VVVDSAKALSPRSAERKQEGVVKEKEQPNVDVVAAPMWMMTPPLQ